MGYHRNKKIKYLKKMENLGDSKKLRSKSRRHMIYQRYLSIKDHPGNKQILNDMPIVKNIFLEIHKEEEKKQLKKEKQKREGIQECLKKFDIHEEDFHNFDKISKEIYNIYYNENEYKYNQEKLLIRLLKIKKELIDPKKILNFNVSKKILNFVVNSDNNEPIENNVMIFFDQKKKEAKKIQLKRLEDEKKIKKTYMDFDDIKNLLKLEYVNRLEFCNILPVKIIHGKKRIDKKEFTKYKKEILNLEKQKKERRESTTAPVIAEDLGISTSTFKKYAPEPKYHYHSKKYDCEVGLWTPIQIEEIKKSKWLQDFFERKQQRKENSKKKIESLKNKYSESELALKASEAMFNLNRYCKHQTCSHQNRNDIYSLKDLLLQKLFSKGYVTSSRYIYDAIVKECYSCDGTGIHYNYNDEEEEECWNCDGTGIYDDQSFWVLRFVVEGTTFTWHTPNYNNFSYKNIDKENLNDDNILQEEKPIEVPRSQLSELKKIVHAYIYINKD